MINSVKGLGQIYKRCVQTSVLLLEFLLELLGSKHHVNCSLALSEATLALRYMPIFQVKDQPIKEHSSEILSAMTKREVSL